MYIHVAQYQLKFIKITTDDVLKQIGVTKHI